MLFCVLFAFKLVLKTLKGDIYLDKKLTSQTFYSCLFSVLLYLTNHNACMHIPSGVTARSSPLWHWNGQNYLGFNSCYLTKKIGYLIKISVLRDVIEKSSDAIHFFKYYFLILRFTVNILYPITQLSFIR